MTNVQVTDNLPLDGAALPLDEAAIKQRFHDAPLLALEEIHEMLDQCRAALALRARVAELERERDECGRLAAEQGVAANVLRDALELALVGIDDRYRGSSTHASVPCAAIDAMRAALKTTPRANLAAYRKSVLEEAAHIAHNWCLVPPDGGAPSAEEAALCEELWKHFRALAAQEEQHREKRKWDAVLAAVERAERGAGEQVGK